MKPTQVVSPRSVLPFPIHTTTTTHVLIRTYVEVRQSQLSTTVKTFFSHHDSPFSLPFFHGLVLCSCSLIYSSCYTICLPALLACLSAR